MSASPPLSFGAWLRQQRESRDWTQQDLAARIGCATITLRKIEADERRPSRQVAALLAEQLGVPPRDRAAFVKLARAASAGDFAEKFLLAPAATQSVDSLPSTPTPLIGRAAELETARLLLLNKKTRLLTLTGTGGIGKTRLAVELAAKLAAHFEDGVYWVDLAAIREPARVLSAIAQTLGVRDNVRVPLLENLQDYLRHKQVLLVLDNFEQVLAAAGDMAALFEKARRLKILVTSRERLHVAGERDLPVPPLELPDLKRVQAAPQLSKAASVVLFIQQARTAKPEFDPARENVVTIAQICHDLEGIPLALELAAARVKILPIKQIASRLENRFRLLRGGTSGTPVRHQTLWNAIDWSYELLSEAERAVLRRLSAFSGGWSLEAAETVCAGDVVADQNVLDLLTLLVDQSLIQVSEREGAARFRMLETIREYAFERLIESGDLARTRQRHLEYFVGLAEEAEPKLSGAEQASWLERLDREEDNLRAAMQWSVSEEGNVDLALRLVSALSRFWYTRNYWDEPYERLLGILQAQSTGARTFLRGKALFAVADLATSLEDFENARALFDEGIGILSELGEKSRPLMEEALTHYAWATVYRDLVNAHRYGEEAARLSRESDNKPGLAASLNVLMLYSLFTCDFDSALKCLEESAATYREIGDQRGFAAALGNIGATYFFQNDLLKAEEFLNRSLAIQREIGDKRNTIATLFHLGNIARIRGQSDEAESLFQQARANLGGEQGKAANARILMFLGRLQLTRGNFSQAVQHARESLGSFREMNQLVRFPPGLENFAFISSASKEPHRAARIFGAAQALREKLGTPLPPVERTEYEAYVAAARAQLDAETFDRAWAEGHAMALERAVEYALADKAEPPSLSNPSPRHSEKLNP